MTVKPAVMTTKEQDGYRDQVKQAGASGAMSASEMKNALGQISFGQAPTIPLNKGTTVTPVNPSPSSNNGYTPTSMSGVNQAIADNKTPQGPYSMDDMKTAIDASNKMGSDSTFKTSDLLEMIKNAGSAGGAVAVRDAKYDSPEAIGGLITQMNQILQPLADSQKSTATSGFNADMQGNRNRWASRGLLASGGAAAQEGKASNALAGQLAGIDAQSQANAIPLAFQAAGLDLQENSQLFGQNTNNRDFLANQAQNGVGNYLNGMNAQLNNNQFDFSKGQANVSNVMNALGFEQQVGQDYIGNMMKATNMDIGQNQFGANLNQNQNQFDARLNQDNNHFNANLNQNQSQFNTSTGQNQSQFNSDMQLQLARLFGNTGNTSGQGGSVGGTTGGSGSNLFNNYQGQQTMDSQQMRENQRQFNIGSAMDLSEMFGQAVMPKQGGDALFNQVKGQDTFKKSSWLQEFGADQQYKQQALGLDWARQATDANYKGYLQQQGKTEDQGKMATNGYLTQIMNKKTPAEAKQYIIDNYEQIVNDGTNVSTLLNAFDIIFPEEKTSKSNPVPGMDLQSLINGGVLGK